MLPSTPDDDTFVFLVLSHVRLKGRLVVVNIGVGFMATVRVSMLLLTELDILESH